MKTTVNREAHMAQIIYTRTDEAPLLATYSLKPIIEAFARKAGIDVTTRDISLASRVLAQFPDSSRKTSVTAMRWLNWATLRRRQKRTSLNFQTFLLPFLSSRPRLRNCKVRVTHFPTTLKNRPLTKSATFAPVTTG